MIIGGKKRGGDGNSEKILCDWLGRNVSCMALCLLLFGKGQENDLRTSALGEKEILI